MLAYAPVPTTPSISGTSALQLLAVALRETAGDDQLLAAPLARRVLEDRLGRFGLRRIDERARVDRPPRRRARRRARAASPAPPSLAIITSVSTRFLAQPRLTNATLRIDVQLTGS